MSERYLVSGAQLGMLIRTPTKKRREKVVEGIIEKQFLFNSYATLPEDVECLSFLGMKYQSRKEDSKEVDER